MIEPKFVAVRRQWEAECQPCRWAIGADDREAAEREVAFHESRPSHVRKVPT